MNRLLLRSSRPNRLNNLKLLFIILPISVLFVMITGRVDSYVHAATTVLPSTYLAQLLYNVDDSNDQSTFPPKVVTVVTADGIRKELVFSDTSENILKELGIRTDLNDMVRPDADRVIATNGVVTVVKVDIELVTKIEDVPFETKEIKTDTLNTGATQVDQKGVVGIREKIIKIVHEDGRVVRSETVTSDIVKKPVEQILLVGTKPVTVAGCDYWGAVVDRITDDAKERRWMKFVMHRESGCDSGRVSHGSGFYKGLFQFAPATFRGKGGVNIWDGTEQIEIVHGMFQQGSDYLGGQWYASHKAYLAKYGW